MRCYRTVHRVLYTRVHSQRLISLPIWFRYGCQWRNCHSLKMFKQHRYSRRIFLYVFSNIQNDTYVLYDVYSTPYICCFLWVRSSISHSYYREYNVRQQNIFRLKINTDVHIHLMCVRACVFIVFFFIKVKMSFCFSWLGAQVYVCLSLDIP